MISVDEVLKMHDVLIREFGGGQGVRDHQLLEAALNRPWVTFGGEELYPTAIEKAVAIVESILVNHPFVDGNKRTGYVLMRLLLLQNGQDLIADQDTRYELIIGIASGQLKKEEILEALNRWVR